MDIYPALLNIIFSSISGTVSGGVVIWLVKKFIEGRYKAELEEFKVYLALKLEKSKKIISSQYDAFISLREAANGVIVYSWGYTCQ